MRPQPDTVPVPFVPFERLRGQLAQEFTQGSHVTLVGPTGCGKTVLELELAAMRRYVIVLATKKRDPMIAQLQSQGYFLTGDLDQLHWTEDGPIHERVIFWPRYPAGLTIEQRQRRQRVDMKRALDFVDATGHWCVCADELIWLTQNLGLAKELNAIWFQGRTQKISLVGCAQRPAWVPRYAFSQATLVAIWQTNDRDDLKKLSELAAGFDIDQVRQAVSELDYARHEFLLINTRTRDLCTSIAPPPKGTPR